MKYANLIRADMKAVRLFAEGVDEFDINIAAYHCQQAVEKTCGYLVQKLGKPSKRTHKIEVWVEYLQEIGVDVPKIIANKAHEISEWEASSRYNVNFVESKKNILGVLEATKTWLEEIESKGVLRVCMSNTYAPSAVFNKPKNHEQKR